MAQYCDRDTKIAYVEQIRSGKMTVVDAVKELGCSKLQLILGLENSTKTRSTVLPAVGV